MPEEKKYSVIELAEIIGVPRTTINDWLGRYSQYIDFVMQGKRRAYTESSVQVLKEVSELRNAGKSSFEIENELAKRYAVHAEPAPPEREDSVPPERGEQPGMRPQVNPMRRSSSEQSSAGGGAAPGPGADTAAAAGTFPEGSAPAENADNSPSASASFSGEDADALSGSPDGAYPLVSRKANEELGRMIAEHIQGMSEKIRVMEEEARRARGRMWLWFLPLLLLLAAVFAVAVFAVAKMRSLEENGRNMARDAEEKERMLEVLKDQTISLGGSSAELRESVRILENGLEEQKKQFEKALSEQRGLYEDARNAELAKKEAEFALEREKFAAQKLEYLRNLERLSSDHEQIVKELENQIRELQQRQEGKGASSPSSSSSGAAPVVPADAAAGDAAGKEMKKTLPDSSALPEKKSVSGSGDNPPAGGDSSGKAASAAAPSAGSAPLSTPSPSSGKP